MRRRLRGRQGERAQNVRRLRRRQGTRWALQAKLFTKENKEKASKALADSKAIAMKHHE